MIDGGAPPGSTVLIASEVGAGGREFLYTCAAMNGLFQSDQDLFDLYYGTPHERSEFLESVNYLSFTAERDVIVREMSYAMADELVDAGVDAIAFEDLSREYFQQSSIPSDWYMDRTQSIASLGDQHDRRDILDALGDYLSTAGPGSLVIIDSVTDLLSAPDTDLDWTGLSLLIKGLKKAANRWGGLVLLHVTLETLSEVHLGRLMDATDGTMLFEWEAGGSERDRTMFVKQFRGVLSQLEDEDIIRFETEIGDGGFDISDVRKIR